MKSKLILIGLIISLGCSHKQEQSKPDLVQPESEMPKDTFRIAGNVILKEYLGAGGNLVTEEEKTYFETVDHQNILIKIKFKTINSRLVDKPDYKLNLKAYKTTSKKYDKLIWEINKEGQIPAGLYGISSKYFKTVDAGCCDTEDGYRLYDIETGKEFLTFTGDLEYSHYPTGNYVGYQAGNSTTFQVNAAKEIIANLYYIQMHPNTDKIDLSTYDIYCESCGTDDARFEHTPVFEIKPKGLLKDEGFFKSFSLYKNGEIINQLDTADYYLTLKYDSKLIVLTPVTEKGFTLTGLLSTDADLSKGLQIKER